MYVYLIINEFLPFYCYLCAVPIFAYLCNIISNCIYIFLLFDIPHLKSIYFPFF